LKKFLAISTFLLYVVSAYPQEHRADSAAIAKDSLSLKDLDNLFTHKDSLDIFELIDSLLKLEPEKGPSQLSLRLGYNSNIVSDNRTFNIAQFGLAPGISYYHKSGAYADVSTYWSQEYQPNLYLSVGSAGYIYTAKKFYTLLAEYSHYFYNQSADSTISAPYTNNLGISNYMEFKPVVIRLDYYFYFGDKVAHRIMPNVGVNLVKRKWLGFDRISFYPNTGMLFGSEEITTYVLYPNLLARYIYNLTHTPKMPLYYENNNTAFGVMNYSFSAPITLIKKDWVFLINYTYNLPQALPGEDLSLQNCGYLSFSISRYITFRKRSDLVATERVGFR